MTELTTDQLRDRIKYLEGLIEKKEKEPDVIKFKSLSYYTALRRFLRVE